MASLTSRSLDSFRCRKTLTVEGKAYEYFSLPDAEANGLPGISALPYSLKVLLENLLRFEDGSTVTADDIRAMAQWLTSKSSTHEIAFRPARVLMQDFTGVPAVVDLAAMRDAMNALHGNTAKINPLVPVDLVIDHSVMVDSFGSPRSLAINTDLEYRRNKERYEFLRWGSRAFANFRVVPPGTGICHQVNLEYLAQTVWTKEEEGAVQAFPDTLVGTDSHTTMINGLAVLGWGVGGIEAEAAMLGQPISMLIPEVIGFRFSGSLREGVTATDLVLTVTQMLRKKGVVGKFVEYSGRGSTRSPWKTGRRWRTWRRNTARPAAFSPLTRIRSTTFAPAAAIRTGSRWWKPMPRRKGCGAKLAPWPPSSPPRSNSISPLSSQASPARAARKTAFRLPAPRMASAMRWRKCEPRSPAATAQTWRAKAGWFSPLKNRGRSRARPIPSRTATWSSRRSPLARTRRTRPCSWLRACSRARPTKRA